MIESKYLKDNTQNIQQLYEIPSLKDFHTKDLSRLLRISKIRHYEDGETIIEEGGLDYWLYFLLSGEVKTTINTIEINSLNTMGDIFGEMRLIDGLSRSVSVSAVGKVICLSVDFAATHRFTSEEDGAAILMMLYKVVAESLSIRLRSSNEELVRAKTAVLRAEQAA